MVFAVGVAIFAEGDVLITVQVVFDTPMLTIIAEQGLRGGFIRRQTGDEPSCFVFNHPLPFLRELARTVDPGNLANAGPGKAAKCA